MSQGRIARPLPLSRWSEATHGISHVQNSEATPFESNFAFPITTAMAFNRSLWSATGAQIGREARAFMNNGDAWSTYWAPVINLAREPRWGRNIETPGEDPYLTGEYATAFVRGFERSPDDPTHLQASACCKHYAANSMEQSTVAGVTFSRHDFDANVTAQDLVDSCVIMCQQHDRDRSSPLELAFQTGSFAFALGTCCRFRRALRRAASRPSCARTIRSTARPSRARATAQPCLTRSSLTVLVFRRAELRERMAARRCRARRVGL